MRYIRKEIKHLLGELLVFANKEETTKLQIREKIVDLLILFEGI